MKAITEAKLAKWNWENPLKTKEIYVSVWSGGRIVKLRELERNKKCFHSHEVILLPSITDKHSKGLNSLLWRLNYKYRSNVSHKFSCYFPSSVR